MNIFIKRCLCLRPEADDVRVLDFRHRSLIDVPGEVFTFERTLEELYLNSNQIHDLPRPLFHCHGLRILGLADNEIHNLPHAIASLINLEELDISKNGVLDIPDNIKGCKCLRVLDASVNPLGKLSEGFTQLINLEELYLNDTFIDFLPANFGRLVKLRILELREDHLKSLSKSMARLSDLTRLDIGQNDFKELPEVIGDLNKLSELWCDCNRIASLPAFIGNLKNLSYLDASQNRISSIAREIESCLSLADLTLTGNDLIKLPESIGKLKNLTVLRLDCNQLQHLPNSIGSLYNLEELILSQNDLKTLPASIGVLRKMHTLIADDNLMEELPSELGSCSGLTILSFRCNRLRFVPDELGHLLNLCILNLSDNRLRYLPFSVTKLRSLQALWLSENQNKPIIPLQSDIDIDTGQRVLTCYIFPQVRQSDFHVQSSDSDSFRLTVWEEQRSQRQHIKFAVDEKLDKPGKCSRIPASYPKELKSHAKHARNQALKSKTANYVNIDEVVELKDHDSIEPTSNEQHDQLEVYKEARVWPVSSPVIVKEARVTKSHSLSPKSHDRRSLHYKLDKQEIAKDEALIYNRTMSSSDFNNSFASVKENVSGSDEHISYVSSTATTALMKFPCLKTNTFENGYAAGDRDVYVNLSVSTPSKAKTIKLPRLDGYSSDAGRNDHYSDGNGDVDALVPGASPLKKRLLPRPATISAAVARKLGCTSSNSSSYEVDSGFTKNSFTDIVPPSGYVRMKPQNSSTSMVSISHRCLQSRSSPVPNLPPRAGPGGCFKPLSTSITGSPHLHGQPSLGLCNPFPSDPPTLPPKRRTSNATPSNVLTHFPGSIYANESVRYQVVSPSPQPISPSQQLRQPPPPYHLAAMYSAQSLPGASLSLQSGSTVHNSSIAQNNFTRGQSSPRHKSPLRDNSDPSYLSPCVQRLTRGMVPAFPALPTPMKIPELSNNDNGRGSNLWSSTTSWRSGNCRPDNLSLSTDDPYLFKARSVSAPSTPPSGVADKSFTTLPPYRIPPLYQSTSTDSLVTRRVDGAGLLKMCLQSPSSLRRFGMQMRGNALSASLHGGLSDSRVSKDSLHSSSSSPAGVFKKRANECRPLNISTVTERSDIKRPVALNAGGQSLLKIANGNMSSTENHFPVNDNDGLVGHSLATRCRYSMAAGNGIFTARPVLIDDVLRRESKAGRESSAAGECKLTGPISHVTPPAINYSSHPTAQLNLKQRHNPWLFGKHNNPKVTPVVIQKNPNLGFTVSWNTDGISSRNEPCIATVTPEGSASSVLKPGDKLLQIDGVDIANMDSRLVHKLLEDTGSTVFLMISRENGH